MSPSSVIAWRGSSLFTGEPIQVVLTGLVHPSHNEKTGPMVQASIIRSDGHAGRDVGTPREQAVCGTCPLAGPKKSRVCYVAWGVWLIGQHAHKFPVVPLSEAAYMCVDKAVRLGNYGDPAAVPLDVWTMLLGGARMWTGYTHAWRSCDQRLRHLCMASVETPQGYLEALGKGWRTFRVKSRDQAVHPSEVACPAQTRDVQCIDCGLCAGTHRPARNIAIDVHGFSGEAHFHRITQLRLAAI